MYHIINMNLFPVRDKILTLIVALHANGNSSYRDAANLCKLSVKKWGDNSTIVILTDNKDLNGGIYVEDKKTFVNKLLSVVKKWSPTHDILFVISAHGYLMGKNEYIRVGDDVVLDHEIRDAFYGEMEYNCHSFCLVDTCHSGTMLDLEWVSTDGKLFRYNDEDKMRQLFVSTCCISACNDKQLAGEDISNFGGWGGKLVCVFLDYVDNLDSDRFQVREFYFIVRDLFSKQSRQRSSPVISHS